MCPYGIVFTILLFIRPVARLFVFVGRICACVTAECVITVLSKVAELFDHCAAVHGISREAAGAELFIYDAVVGGKGSIPEIVTPR